jgi:hypothetical protein
MNGMVQPTKKVVKLERKTPKLPYTLKYILEVQLFLGKQLHHTKLRFWGRIHNTLFSS